MKPRRDLRDNPDGMYFQQVTIHRRLNRLRKKAWFWAKSAKTIPRGLKPTLILRLLRHATPTLKGAPVPRSCPRKKQKWKFNKIKEPVKS